MELGSQHPYRVLGVMGGRRRIAGIAAPNAMQDVAMGEPVAGQLPGTNADAELEELCSSLPGWHQQQSSHDPGGLLGGLARTVSAPSAFLLSASRGMMSPGLHGPAEGLSGMSTGPNQDNYSGAFTTLRDSSSALRQPPVLERWLFGRPTVSNSPLRNAHFTAGEPANGSSLSAGNNSIPGEDRPWPTRSGAWNTMLPPGEQHTTAMLQSLVHTNSLEPCDPNETNTLGGIFLVCQLGRPMPHTSGGGGARSSGGGSQRSSHFANHIQHLQHLSPQTVGTGLSDWPSGGRMVGGSSGLQLLSGPSAGASALSAPLSGPSFAPRQAASCGEPLRATGSSGVDLPVCTTRGSPAPSTGQGVPSGRGLMTAPLRIYSVGPASPNVQMDQLETGAAGCVLAGDGMQGLAMAERDAVAEGAEGGMHLDMEHDANGGSGMQSASSGSSMCTAINGALMAAAGCDVAVSGDGGAIGYAPATVAVAAVDFDDRDTAAATTAEDEDCKESADCRAGGNAGRPNSGGAGRTDKSNRDSVAALSGNDSGMNLGEAGSPGGDGGLQLLAMRFRNRPGRVPKAVAKLGPIAELAKSAATGRIKLDKDELDDLVLTVETNLARAVTEQKEDSRARNRVAQQRFRNRQRETIAALQAKVEEQQALIFSLQEKIRVYEAQQHRVPQVSPQQQLLATHQEGGGNTLKSARKSRRSPHE